MFKIQCNNAAATSTSTKGAAKVAMVAIMLVLLFTQIYVGTYHIAQVGTRYYR